MSLHKRITARLLLVAALIVFGLTLMSHKDAGTENGAPESPRSNADGLRAAVAVSTTGSQPEEKTGSVTASSAAGTSRATAGPAGLRTEEPAARTPGLQPLKSRGKPVRDRHPDVTTIEEKKTDLGKGYYHRVRIVRSDFVYPLLRIEELVKLDAPGQQEILLDQKAMVADHVLVQLREGVSAGRLRKLAKSCGATIRREMHTPGLYLVAAPEPDVDTVPRLVEALSVHKAYIKFVEPDYLAYLFDTLPNDPSYGSLWNMDKVDAPAAWDLNTGGDVVIGVVDSGVDYNHPDLADNMWINEGEIADNGIDDDNNGFVDDVYGWDFYEQDSDPKPGIDHGTHVAGTIAAVGNNARGVAGVMWEARIMALKIAGEENTVSASAAADALYYVGMMKQRGVDIRLTNHSWGGGTFITSLRKALLDNRTRGILAVCAAGNNYGRDTDENPIYPACYDLDNIIAVAATGSSDELADFSNYGATTIDLGAPGVNIYSTETNNRYDHKSGTSMATPCVSGAAGLLWDYTTGATYGEIKEAIMQGTDPVSSLDGKTLSGGRLNVFGAMKSMQPVIVHKPLDNQVNSNSTYNITATLKPADFLDTNELWVAWTTNAATGSMNTSKLDRVAGLDYHATIETQAAGSVVSYYLSASTTNGLTSTDPTNAPSGLHSFSVVEPLMLWIEGNPADVGTVNPAYGVHEGTPSGIVINATAPAFAEQTQTRRYRCEGWHGMGSAPSDGDSNSVSFTIHKMSAVQWQWEKQYSLIQTSSPAGSVDSASWWPDGSSGATVQADSEFTDGTGTYHFVEWQIDGVRWSGTNTTAMNPAAGIAMTTSRQAQAVYLEESIDVDSDSVADWWERYYFGNVAASATNDPDGDGADNGAEFADRTDPLDNTSSPRPPLIAHVPLSTVQSQPAPWPVSAVITDNHRVTEATLWWNRNNEGWQDIPITNVSGSTYQAPIPAPGTNTDQYAYYISASDELGLMDQTGTNTFEVVYAVAGVSPGSLTGTLLQPGESTNHYVTLSNYGNTNYEWSLQKAWVDDIEDGTNDWTEGGENEIWGITSRRFYSPSNAWYLGSQDLNWEYGPSMQAELTTPQLPLWSNARLEFRHWIAAETVTNTTDWAWDGGAVFISTNGSSFEQIEPTGSYSHRIENWEEEWLPDGGTQFPQDTPCFAGTGGWETVVFDLSQYSNTTAQIRFEFRGDDNTQKEGWYIDDVVVVSDLNSNDWLHAAPRDGTLVTNGAHNIGVSITAPDVPSADLQARLRLTGNDPGRPVIDIPVSAMVRSPPDIEIFSAAQTSTNGAGIVTVSNLVSDPAGRNCDIEIKYSVDNGDSWFSAWITNASPVYGFATVTNSPTTQIHSVDTEDSGTLITNTAGADWNTFSNSLPALTTNVLVRARTWNGAFWSRPATSQPFAVDNQPPESISELQATSHEPGTWSTNPVVSVGWNPSSDGEGFGVSHYCVLFTNELDAFQFLSCSENSPADSPALPDNETWWVAIRAVDNAGNKGAYVSSGPYGIDTAPPSAAGADIIMETSPYGPYIVGTNLTGAWSGFSDSASGLAGYFFSTSDQSGTTNGAWTTGTEGTVTIPQVLLDRTNQFYVWARDNAGSIGSAASADILALDGDADFDNDGMSTSGEIIAGTDSSDPSSALEFKDWMERGETNDSEILLEWNSQTGRTYTLYHRPELLEGSWLLIPDHTNVPGTGGTMSYTHSVGTTKRGYYRIVVERAE